MSHVDDFEYREHLFDVLPLRDATDVSCDDEDVVYCDGDVWFHGSVVGDELDIHDLISMRVSDRGARRGIGRAAMERLRPHFSRIAARQVGEDPMCMDDTPPLESQRAFLFWKAMLSEGLVDEIYVGHASVPLTRENMSGPVETVYGTVSTLEGESALAPA